MAAMNRLLYALPFTLKRNQIPSLFLKSCLIKWTSSRSSSVGPKIYTKTGDKGYTSTYGGERRSKTDALFEALGTCDELSSVIGVAREFCEEGGHKDIMQKLEEVQCILQDVGSNIATPRHSSPDRNIRKTEFDPENVVTLEDWIDMYHNQLSPLRSFILPSGGKSSAMLHVARSVCRRAERRVVPLVQSGSVDPEVGTFLNRILVKHGSGNSRGTINFGDERRVRDRLSDFLFIAARIVAKMEGKTEQIYRRIKR